MFSNIFLVAHREYLTRVRKRSFIVMTLLAPLLMASFYGIIIYLSINKEVGNSVKEIYVNDESGQFMDQLHSSVLVHYNPGAGEPIPDTYRFLQDEGFYALLHIRKLQDSAIQADLIYTEQPGLTVVNDIESELNRVLRESEMIRLGIDADKLKQANDAEVKLSSVKMTSNGKESGSAEVTTAIGFISAIAIYMFIFLYGVQVMQGVIEEKTNRIVEIIISSVKPFQLMMGKITGIAMVGLTQFLIWVLLMVVAGGTISGWVVSQFGATSPDTSAAAQGNDFIAALLSVNYPLIIGMFLFYFVSGYLFYGALFAAIGSAIDNETDKQQFMLPVTLPLIFAFVLSQSIIVTSPNGTLATWMSMIPFTSPVTMMVRLPFGVPIWQLALSMFFMVIGIFGTVWLAARIYRVGILMYGKKATYAELWKWLFYRP